MSGTRDIVAFLMPILLAASIAAAKQAPDTSETAKRNKISYSDYQARVSHKADSILAANYHHGISIVPARYQDKTYGKVARGADWGGGFGLYYFYRHYFYNYFSAQAHAGFIYRYASFKEDSNTGKGKFQNGESYELNRHLDLSYHNFALDFPITAKFGTHIEPTTFVFASLTFGLTKPLYEHMYADYTLDFNDPPKELAHDLELIGDAGKNPFPMEEIHEINKPFFMDDWETNGWIGLGIDGKYASVQAQFLLASGSSDYENHRYYGFSFDRAPTFRIFFDFSLR
jgi:hypothetical protein